MEKESLLCRLTPVAAHKSFTHRVAWLGCTVTCGAWRGGAQRGPAAPRGGEKGGANRPMGTGKGGWAPRSVLTPSLLGRRRQDFSSGGLGRTLSSWEGLAATGVTSAQDATGTGRHCFEPGLGRRKGVCRGLVASPASPLPTAHRLQHTETQARPLSLPGGREANTRHHQLGQNPVNTRRCSPKEIVKRHGLVASLPRRQKAPRMRICVVMCLSVRCPQAGP